MSAAPNQNLTGLKRLPLHDLHLQLGAAMCGFAGYVMPVHYALGVLKEHLHVRAAAGLFDVSHMGQVMLRPHAGMMEEAASGLERLAPADVLGLPQYRLRYSFFINANGGIEDDLMIGNCADRFMLVVNAGRKQHDAALLRAGLSDVCTIEILSDRALLSLQGPEAEDVLTALSPAVGSMRFMDVRLLAIGGADCVVTRSGYTGEDGFEISIEARDAERFVRTLLQNPAVRMAGLGARDSLRTEAGLCLYGADLDANTTPVEAALEWAIPRVRRNSGERAGGFPGADTVLEQLSRGAARRRVGLRPSDRTPIRGGTPLYSDGTAVQSIGTVTSGGFSPSLSGPIAIGYIPTLLAMPDQTLFAEVRGQRHAAAVTTLPFVPHRYKRIKPGGTQA
jgi:aminomethyltransferase